LSRRTYFTFQRIFPQPRLRMYRVRPISSTMAQKNIPIRRQKTFAACCKSRISGTQALRKGRQGKQQVHCLHFSQGGEEDMGMTEDVAVEEDLEGIAGVEEDREVAEDEVGDEATEEIEAAIGLMEALGE
jgi:hypothetical protein